MQIISSIWKHCMKSFSFCYIDYCYKICYYILKLLKKKNKETSLQISAEAKTIENISKE